MPSYWVLQAHFTHASNLNTLKENSERKQTKTKTIPGIQYLVGNKINNKMKVKQTNQRKTKKEDKAKGEPKLGRERKTNNTMSTSQNGHAPKYILTGWVLI